MKIKRLLFALLSVGLLLGTQGLIALAQEDELTQTYTRSGFSINYPEGWAVDEEQFESQIIFSTDEDTEIDALDAIEKGRVIVGIALPESLAELGLESDTDPAQVMTVLNELLYPQGELRSIDTFTIGEGEGLRSDGVNGEGAYVMLAALSYPQAGTLVAIVITPEEEFAEREATVLAMLESITFGTVEGEEPAPETTDSPEGDTPEAGMPLDQTYTTGGFSVDYPAGWVVVGEEPGLVVELSSDEGIELGTEEGLTSGQFGIGILLPDAPDQIGLGEDATAEDMLTFIAAGFLEVEAGELEPESITVQGFPALIVRSDKSVVIAVEFGAGIVTLGGETAAGEVELVETLALQILESITIDLSQASTTPPTVDEIIVPRLRDEYAYADPGFSIRVPSGWVVDDTELPAQISFTSGDFDVNIQSLSPGDVIIGIVFPGSFEDEFGLTGDATPADFAEVARNDTLQVTADVSEIATETIAGYETAAFTLEMPEITTKFIFFQIDGEHFVLALRTPPGYLEAYNDFTANVLESFQWNVDLDEMSSDDSSSDDEGEESVPEPVATEDVVATEEPDTLDADTGDAGMPPPLEQTYTDGGFSIDYPVGWVVVNSEPGFAAEMSTSEEVRIGVPDSLTSGQYGIGLLLPEAGAQLAGADEASPEVMMDFIAQGFLDLELDDIEPESITVQGFPALITRNDEAIAITVGFDAGTLTMGGQTSPDNVEQLEIIMLQMLDTVVFSESSDAVLPTLFVMPTMTPTAASEEALPTLVPTPVLGAIELPELDTTFTYDELGLSLMYPAAWRVWEDSLPYQLELTSGEFVFNSEDLISGQVALGLALPAAFDDALDVPEDATLEEIAGEIREFSLSSNAVTSEVAPFEAGDVEAVRFTEQMDALETALVVFRVNGVNLALAIRTPIGELPLYDALVVDFISSVSIDADAASDGSAQDGGDEDTERPTAPPPTQEASSESRLNLRDDKTENAGPVESNRRLKLPGERDSE